MRLRVLLQVTRMTFREFIRTPGAVFWTYGFPLLMALSLGFAFRTSEPARLTVAVVEKDFAPAQLDALRANPRLDVRLLGDAAADDGFRHGRFLLVASAEGGAAAIRLDPVRPEAELARLQVERALQAERAPEAMLQCRIVAETTPGWRYIDWLIPGLIALNLLGAGLWGVGYNLVQMRVKNILRRLMVTPMRRSEFLVAFLLSRLFFVIPEAGAILGFGALVFDVPVHGSLLTVLLLVLLGAVSFTGLGMLVASRAATTETVSGLMNVIMLPMWIFGGCFFSNDRFPAWLVDVLPITHLNEALRKVMSDGVGVDGVAPQVAFLAIFGVVVMALAIRVFRWT